MFDFFGKKEGPGVAPDAPRKKGLARFFEVLGSDFGSIYFSGLISFVAFFPAILGLTATVMSLSVGFALLFGLITGMIASPFYAVLIDTILRAQRDEPGYWWVRYRKAFANNWKASLLPGAIFGILIHMEALCVVAILQLESNVILLASFFLSIVVVSFLILWVYPQLVLFDLPLIVIIRNAMIISFSQLPRSFAAVLLILAYWGAFGAFFPYSVLVIFFPTVWLPAFIGLSFIYVPLDSAFEVEKLTEEKRLQDAANAPIYRS